MAKAAPKYVTRKSQVSLGSGQHLAFTKGKGYFADSTPLPDPDVAAANKSVGQQIAASLAPIRTQESQAHAQSLAQGQQLSGLSTGLADYLAQIAPATQQTFDQAGDRQATYAKGYSTNLANAANDSASSLNAYLAKLGNTSGAPVAQNGTQLGDVLYGLGGAMPATEFSKAGAAFTAAAKQLPAEAIGRGQDALAANNAAWGKTAQTYANQIAGLEAKRPGLVQSQVNSLHSQELRQAAYDAAMQRLQGTLTGTYTDASGKTVPTYAATTHKQTVADRNAAAAAKAAATATAARTKAVGKRTDATAKAVDTLTTYAESKLPYKVIGQQAITKTVHPPKVGNITPAPKTLYLRADGTWTQDAHDPTIQYNKHYDKTQHADKFSQQQYQKLWGYTIRYLQTNLGRYGYKRSDLTSIAHQILDPLAPPKQQTRTYTDTSSGTLKSTSVTGP